MSRRHVDIVVISDIHLGTCGCRASEVLAYLSRINPRKLILNGDIVDGWQFKKKYWPASHTKVVKEILHLAAKGTEVYYLPGNHDEYFRKFVGYTLGNIHIENKLVQEIDGKMAWFFHGDVFDVTMQHSKWLTRLGSESYDFLIWLNYQVNRVLEFMGREKKSFSKQIKNGVKSAVKYINKFEELCAEIAVSKGYDYVICGHIHQPEIRSISFEQKTVTYLNSGDWVENLTALEYNSGEWSIHTEGAAPKDISEDKNTEELFQEMLLELGLPTAAR